MNKFYVQSGQMSWTVHSEDAEGAALWALNQTIGHSLQGVDFESAPAGDEALVCLLDALARLDSKIDVSQIGLGRHEAGQFDTGELFTTWRSLSSSLDFLFDPFN